MEAAGDLFDFRTLRLVDGMDNYGAWPTPNRDVVAKLATTCGMLVPSVDPLKPPFRAVGLLWENGDFARNSSSAILSFASSAGVILAATNPNALAERFVCRNDAAWPTGCPPLRTNRQSGLRRGWKPFSRNVSTSSSRRNLSCGSPARTL